MYSCDPLLMPTLASVTRPASRLSPTARPSRMDNFIFLHIPKTGGSSLLQYFRDVFDEGSIYVYGAEHPRFPDTPERFAIIAGHFYLHDIRHLLDSRYTFTFLRNPIDAAISKYYFYRRINDPRIIASDRDVALAQQYDFDACIAAYADEPWSCYANQQVTMLAGRRAPYSSPQDMLAAAQHNLRALSFVGLYEKFWHSVDLLALDCGWPKAKHFPHLNKTESRPKVADISRLTHERLVSMNQQDIALYELATQLFASREQPRQQPESNIPRSGQGFLSVDHTRRESGSRECTITSLSFNPPAAAKPSAGHPALVELSFTAGHDCTALEVGLAITDEDGIVRYGINSRMLGQALTAKAGQTYRASFALELWLPRGVYYVTVALHSRDGQPYHWVDNALSFSVDRENDLPFLGRNNCRALFSMAPSSEMLAMPPKARRLVRIRFLGSLDDRSVGAHGEPSVVVENLSDTWLASQPPHPIHLSYHLLDPDKKMVVFEGTRTPLLPALAPRSRAVYGVTIDRSLKGRFILRVMLVQEGAAWFDDSYDDLIVNIA